VKCLSIRQPFAAAVLLGLKDVEFRTWQTSYRGDLLIHAGKSIPPAEWLAEWPEIDPAALVYGAVLGVVELVECQPDPDEEGVFLWLLDNPCPLKRPQPLKGNVGLFNIDDALLAGLLPAA
jgi:hypothetical protein